MAQIVGKRKRRESMADESLRYSSSTDDADSAQIQLVLKQHFEATFDSLPVLERVSTTFAECEDQSDHDEDMSDWEGISEGYGDDTELVQYKASRSAKIDVPPKDEIKGFMTSKPPSTRVRSTRTTNGKRVSTNPSEDADESANLKKDLALHRLLKESHLLDRDSFLSHTGRNRHKVLDLRLRDMGAKASIFSQQKMPMAQRKGIMAKAAEREENRRRDARENGIILEKASQTKRRVDAKRERGIGAPAVGKFHGGTLRLSKKDIAEIQGPKRLSGIRR